MFTLVFTVVATLAVYTGAMPPTEHPPTTSTGGGGCVYDGSVYPVGEFQTEDPCFPCFCFDDGEVQCPSIIYDCIIPCVDPVYEKDQCCPSCPNGHNCQGPNGNVIPAGQPVVLPSGETCACLEKYGFFASPPPAQCSPAPPFTPPTTPPLPPHSTFV